MTELSTWQHLYHHLSRSDSDRLMLLVKMFPKLIVCFLLRTAGDRKQGVSNKPEDALLLGDSTPLRINDILYAIGRLPAKIFYIMENWPRPNSSKLKRCFLIHFLSGAFCKSRMVIKKVRLGLDPVCNRA
jgi:hypothetical protein